MNSARTNDHVRRWTPSPKCLHTLAANTPGSILLETSRFDPSNKESYLFLDPASVISATELNDVPQLFSKIEEALAKGFHVAGYLSYESGYHFERFRVAPCATEDLPLAWLGVYEQPLVFDHERGCFDGTAPAWAWESNPNENTIPVAERVALGITWEEYRQSVLKIKECIASGETYQVNFTDEISFYTDASASMLFESLRRNQSVAYGALMNVAGWQILSFSPELFFRIGDGTIVTRPMKGTMPRGLDLAEDARASLQLQNDEKNRSEHVMIVDLLRNDLGRICTTGSIRVEDLFFVEKYETLLQMTSTISGVLRPDIRYYEIFQSLFPSGSVTGAPKIRAMKIIQELEEKRRGIYTGAIGFMAPDGRSVFNVAIRTMVVKDGRGRMGVGGGIVADSEPADEYRECLLKAAFLSRPHHDFQLIETMLWEKEFCFLDWHLERLKSSASYFQFPFERETIRSRLYELSNAFATNERYRVRLLLNARGHVNLERSEIRTEQSLGDVMVSLERTSSMDVFLRHKTTRRGMYDRQYAEARANGFDEVIFTNEKGEVTEGAISNVFIERDGKLITPPTRCGVLPGILRRHVLESSVSAEERILTMDDLKNADGVFLGNSVRGLRKVRSLCFDACEGHGCR